MTDKGVGSEGGAIGFPLGLECPLLCVLTNYSLTILKSGHGQRIDGSNRTSCRPLNLSLICMEMQAWNYDYYYFIFFVGYSSRCSSLLFISIYIIFSPLFYSCCIYLLPVLFSFLLIASCLKIKNKKL